jgi:CheY-like chemotaxis protein
MEILGPRQILFVDPDSANAQYAGALLEQWGLRVTIAESYREAIELTKTNIYDLILMDIESPDTGGVRTAHIIRRLGDQFQDIPIIGYGTAPVNLTEHELTDFILNPFNHTELYNKLKDHLDKTQPDMVMANLDRCTDGDPEFRRELAQLLANNITELLTNIEKALVHKDPNIFIRAVHKTKTTLSILNDGELTENISIVQAKLKEPTPVDLEQSVEKLSNRCKSTITILNQLSTV